VPETLRGGRLRPATKGPLAADTWGRHHHLMDAEEVDLGTPEAEPGQPGDDLALRRMSTDACTPSDMAAVHTLRRLTSSSFNDFAVADPDPDTSAADVAIDVGVAPPSVMPVPPGMFSHSVVMALAAQQLDVDSDTSSRNSGQGEHPWGLVRAAASPGGPQISCVTDGKSFSRKLRKVPTLSSEGQRQTLMKMSSLSLTSPNLLRATYASVPLRWFGRVFRSDQHAMNPPERSVGFARQSTPGGDSSEESSASSEASPRSSRRALQSHFSMSFPTDTIDDFWTHSWCGNPVLKTLVLLLQYNLLGATVMSMLAAMFAMVLTSCDALPALEVGPTVVPAIARAMLGGQPLPLEEPATPVWSQAFGLVAFILTLLLWQSGKRVFLDKMCIEQNDVQKKQQGVECIGAFLSYSRKILVLWDPSYTTRLWCVFELAAFAWAHDNHVADKVIVRPLLFGAVFPCLMVTSLFCNSFLLFSPWDTSLSGVSFSCLVSTSISFLFTTHLLRHLGRDIRRMSDHLQGYMVAQADCYCCSMQHQDPETGAKMSCDRQVIQACIMAWFGSLKEFEDFVQSDLAPRFRSSIGRVGVPYWWVVASQIPFMWSHLDQAVPFLRCGHWQAAGAILLSGLFLWLIARPLAVSILIKLARCFSKQRESPLLDLAVTCGTALLAFLINFVFQGPLFFFFSTSNPMIGPSVCVIASVVACSLLYRC